MNQHVEENERRAGALLVTLEFAMQRRNTCLWHHDTITRFSPDKTATTQVQI
jgi:hypothetical protein